MGESGGLGAGFQLQASGEKPTNSAGSSRNSCDFMWVDAVTYAAYFTAAFLSYRLFNKWSELEYWQWDRESKSQCVLVKPISRIIVIANHWKNLPECHV